MAARDAREAASMGERMAGDRQIVRDVWFLAVSWSLLFIVLLQQRPILLVQRVLVTTDLPSWDLPYGRTRRATAL